MDIRKIIKGVLLEHVETFDTVSMIKNYDGNNKILLGLKDKLLRTDRPLTQKQMEYAIDLFKKEFYARNIYEEIKNSKSLRNLITNYGIETYKNLVRSSKSKFFKTSINPQIKVDKPSMEWVERNISDLHKFLDLTVNSPDKFKFEDRDIRLTTHQEAKLLIQQLENQDFRGFLEKKGDSYEWSILNRIGSHWTNWAKMITKRGLKGDLGEGSTKSKIDNYFEQRDIGFFYKDEFENLSDEMKFKIWKVATRMSYADFDIIESFLEHQQDSPTFGPAIDTLENMMNRIAKTTRAGDIAEENFIEWLIQEKGVSESDIYKFSSFGNLVDITFQVDLIVRLNGKWIPIQVKNSETKTKLLSYKIGGILVFPTEKSKIDNYGPWSYESKGDYPRSFEKDFFS